MQSQKKSPHRLVLLILGRDTNFSVHVRVREMDPFHYLLTWVPIKLLQCCDAMPDTLFSEACAKDAETSS